jgi:F-type H+-transporting ATPase subunit gamma
MAQVREIKRRITSVRNTQQITRAMKMVAAAKLRKAQTAMMAMRPYSERITGIIDKLAFDLFGDEHPLFNAREEKNTATIVIAGDKGLCGGFNSNIIRQAKKHFAEHNERKHQVWSIGKRATSSLKKMDSIEIIHSYQDVFDNLSYVLANEICQDLVGRFMDGTIDSAYIVYNEFVSVISQNPIAKKILPMDFSLIQKARKEREAKNEEEGIKEDVREMYELEPDPQAVMQKLIGRLIATQVYHATLESYAAELGARMSAMDSATSNADEMIDRLSMEYNRARQSGITSELLDIVGGAEGLKG